MTNSNITCPICEQNTQVAHPTLCGNCGWEFLYFSQPNPLYEELQNQKKEIFKKFIERQEQNSTIVTELREQINTIVVEKNSLEKQVVALLAKLDTLKKQAEEAKHHRNIDYENQITQLKDEITELKKRIVAIHDSSSSVNNPNLIRYSIDGDRQYLRISFTQPISISTFPIGLQFYVSETKKEPNLFIHNADWSILINNRGKLHQSGQDWLFQLPKFLTTYTQPLYGFLYLHIPGIYAIGDPFSSVQF